MNIIEELIVCLMLNQSVRYLNVNDTDIGDAEVGELAKLINGRDLPIFVDCQNLSNKENVKMLNELYQRQMIQKRLIKICIATASPLKIQAVSQSFSKLFQNAEIVTVSYDTKSNVNEQPKGHDETIRGAKNRLSHLKSILKENNINDFDYLVAIENGLLYMENIDTWYDIGWVLIEGDHGNRHFTMSCSVLLPTHYVEQAREIGFEKITVGSLLSKDLGCNSKDPHHYLTHGFVSRIELLVQAVCTAIGQLLTYIPK